MRFKDKVVIITGAANGIGEATAKKFSEEGAHIVVADFSENGKNVAEELSKTGQKSIFVKTDVSNSADVQNMIKVSVDTFKRIDILFANAGIAADAVADKLTEENWQRTIGINLSGVFLCNKYAIEQFLAQGGGGAIVNCGSIHSLVGKSGVTAYAAAKGGVKLLTQTLGIDYAKHNIRVNAVCPGYIDTALLNDVPRDVYNALVSLHPMGRLGRTEEVANSVMFLASEDASFITGTTLAIDGGYTAQ